MWRNFHGEQPLDDSVLGLQFLVFHPWKLVAISGGAHKVYWVHCAKWYDSILRSDFAEFIKTNCQLIAVVDGLLINCCNIYSWKSQLSVCRIKDLTQNSLSDISLIWLTRKRVLLLFLVHAMCSSHVEALKNALKKSTLPYFLLIHSTYKKYHATQSHPCEIC